MCQKTNREKFELLLYIGAIAFFLDCFVSNLANLTLRRSNCQTLFSMYKVFSSFIKAKHVF